MDSQSDPGNQTCGSSAAYEASANLFNWVPLVTNASPFQFTDTNFDTFLFPLRAIWRGQVALPPNHFTFNSRWMPNFSMRLRSVARVMPSSFAACTWLLLVSLSAWMTSSRSTAGMTFNFGSRLAH